MDLQEIPLPRAETPLTPRAAEFLAAGRSRFDSVNCFEFVPSNYELVWRCLSGLPRGRFCEWGSGFGLTTGLAELLGFTAHGIEIDKPLAEASRQLLAEFQLTATISTGDYLEDRRAADLYFVYCWPSRMMATEQHFAQIAPPEAKLIICHGQSDLRCKVRAT